MGKFADLGLNSSSANGDGGSTRKGSRFENMNYADLMESTGKGSDVDHSKIRYRVGDHQRVDFDEFERGEEDSVWSVCDRP